MATSSVTDTFLKIFPNSIIDSQNYDDHYKKMKRGFEACENV